MANLMTQIYIAYVEEIIYVDGKATLELRVRVPSVHGASATSGLAKNDLPIAKPLLMPGVSFNYTLLEETIASTNKVFVIFESGDLSKPVYFGLKGNEELFNIPGNTANILYFDDDTEFPAEGDPSLIYWAQDVNILYYWTTETSEYRELAGFGSVIAELSRDNHVFAADIDGNIFTYDNSGTTINVKQGTTDIQYEIGSGFPVNNGRYRVEAIGTDITPGALFVSGLDAVVSNASAMTLAVDSAIITYTIYVRTIFGQEVMLTKTQTFSKLRQSVGLDGYNEGKIYLYKRALTKPNTPSITAGEYYFVLGTWAGLIVTEGFTRDIPDYSGDPLWVSVVSVASRDTSYVVTDPIVGTEPALFVKDGINTATLYIYKRADIEPSDSIVGDSTYTFATGTLTLPVTTNGWTLSIPETGGRHVWYRTATAASSKELDTIPDTEWSAVGMLSSDGIQGPQGLQGAPGAEGADGINARAVDLIASQLAIEYDPEGDLVTTSILITAYAKNVTLTPYYWFYVNGVAQGIEPTTTSTFTYTDMAATYVDGEPTSIEVELREGSDDPLAPIVARDEVSLYPVKSGSDALTVTNSNGNHTISTDAAGLAFSYAGSGTTIEVLQGTTKLTYVAGTTYPASSGYFSVVAVGTGISVGNISPSGQDALVADASNMTADNATITYTIYIKTLGGKDVDLITVQSFSKSKQGIQGLQGAPGAAGAAGLNARTVKLLAEKLAIEYNPEGQRSAEAVTLTATAYGLSGTAYFEFFVNNISQGAPTTTATFDYMPSTTYVNSPITIEVEVREGADDGPIVARDEVSLYPVKSGSSTINVMGSNLDHTFTAANDGTVSDYTGSGTTIEVLEGTTPLQFETGGGSPTANGRFTISRTATNISAGAVSVSGTKALFGDASSMSTSEDLAAIVYTVKIKTTYGNGLEPTIVQSFSKSKAGNPGNPGNPGSPAIHVELTNDNETVPSELDGSGALLTGTGGQIELYSAGTKLTTGVTYSGSATKNGLILTVTAGGSYSLSGTWSTISDKESFNLTATYLGISYTKVYTVTKAKKGLTGPGMVYRGEWTAGVYYFAPDTISTRTDVVKGSDNKYYYCTVSHTAAEDIYKPITGTSYGIRWSAFGTTFSSVATGLLIAEDSYIRNTINIGTNAAGDAANITITGADTTSPYISIGQGATKGYNANGIFLGRHDGASKLSIVGSGSNSLVWDGSALNVHGDIGGTIGSLVIGTPDSYPYKGIKISSDGILAYNGDISTPSVSIGSDGEASFSGTIKSTSGKIGGWNIEPTRLVGLSTGGGQSILTPDYLFLQDWSGMLLQALRIEKNLINFENGNGAGLMTQVGPLLVEAVLSTMLIRAYSSLSLHSTNDYVYASNGLTSPTNPTNKITVYSSGVSTKIVKTNIESLDYDKVKEFLDIVEPKSFTNIMKNKQKISIIIEDEENKNLPFKDLLFKREDKAFRYESLPDFLKPYEFDKETIQKEIDDSGNSYYYFSPKTIDSQTMQGVMLASIKYNHERLKVLEEENENLRELIKRILVKVGEV